MGLISFINNHCRRQKEIRLAGLKAQLQSELDSVKISTSFSSYILSDLARKIAELEKDLSYEI